MRNENWKGIGREFTCRQAGGIRFEPHILVASGSQIFRAMNLGWQTIFFVPTLLLWYMKISQWNAAHRSLQNRFGFISIECSNSVEEDAIETSPWLCTWLLLLEPRVIPGSQKICMRRGLGVQLCLQTSEPRCFHSASVTAQPQPFKFTSASYLLLILQ